MNIQSIAGRGTSAETCGLNDVFPPDDLGSGLYIQYLDKVIRSLDYACFCPWTFSLNTGIEHANFGLFCVMFRFSICIFHGGVPGLQLIVLVVFGTVD